MLIGVIMDTRCVSKLYNICYFNRKPTKPSPKYTLQPKKPTKEPPRLRRVMDLIVKLNLDRTIPSINNDFIPSP